VQFTKLRLQGFKSFVDPTELVIGEGLTAVVGPNGCGKSNLLEALRWVMGENRPTAVRGSGMEDVIFAGAGTRPARNSASVELVIDNAERLAPAMLNDADQIEVSRRITRDIGSAYHINGKPVRARDVTMLFADASTGAHSPALVRQGQISELINAKPVARRRVLEEAAGIAGLYQRRHEAELKLNAAGTNLGRVEELIAQLDSQLRTLERQAGQAARYRQIAEELRRAEAVLLLLRWRAAAADRAKAEAELAEGTRGSARAEAAARETARAREETEALLPPLRDELTTAGAVRQRLEIEASQIAEAETRAEAEIATLAARAEQLTADLAREHALSGDADAAIQLLDDEATGLGKAADGHEATLAKADEAARGAGERLSAEESRHDRMAEDAARLSARAKAAARRREVAAAGAERLAGDIAKAEAEDRALAEAEQAADRAEGEAAAAAAQARERAQAAEVMLGETEAALTAAQEAERAARGARAEAEGRSGALASEVDGLERLLAREAGDGPRLLDAIRVAPGLEAALGAALGDDLQAPETEADGTTGWRLLDMRAGAGLPAGAECLAGHVEAPAVLARRLAQTGVVDAAAGAALQAALHPGQRLVSREGDLWRWDGYAQAAADAPSAAARRLEQSNRLTALGHALAEARDAEAAARAVHEGAKAEADGAGEAEAAARKARRDADQALADAARRQSRAEAEREMIRGKRAAQADLLAARRAEHAEMEAERAAAIAAEGEIDDPEAARQEVSLSRGRVDLARTEMLAARAKADEIRRSGAVREKRLGEIARERKGWHDRRSTAARRVADLERRIAETETAQAEAAGRPQALRERAGALAEEVARATARETKARDAVAEAEAGLRLAEQAERAAERAASEAREARGRFEGLAEAAAQRHHEAAQAVEAQLSETAEALEARLDLGDEAPTLQATETEVQKLTRQRDAIGPVNLRAEEDAREVAAERDALAAEKAELDEAVAKLRTGIQELNREGRQRLTAAFEAVNTRFSELFRHLFGGGEARLVMVESEDPLDAGLEILCQPPGKKLSTLSLLSGGEQTLTALSLILAVFLTNPAPICVLDEVDAPLDDSNVARFCALLDRMVKVTDTRFLVITHNPITMSRMDRLFGVTMVEQGVSQLVSVDLSRAAEIVGH